MTDDRPLYGSADAIERLRTTYWRLNHLHRTGRIPEVRMVGGRRLYTERDLERIRGILEQARNRS